MTPIHPLKKRKTIYSSDSDINEIEVSIEHVHCTLNIV